MIGPKDCYLQPNPVSGWFPRSTITGVITDSAWSFRENRTTKRTGVRVRRITDAVRRITDAVRPVTDARRRQPSSGQTP